jgi:hypothetical protein
MYPHIEAVRQLIASGELMDTVYEALARTEGAADAKALCGNGAAPRRSTNGTGSQA